MEENVFTFLQNRANVRWEKDSSGSWLVFDINGEERILQYQVEMIRHNRRLQAVIVHKRQVNERVELWYEAGETVPLANYLREKNLTRDGLLDVLDLMIKCVSGCKNYFLYDRCFLLDIDYLFIHPRSLTVFFVYLPLLLGGDAESNFQRFLRQLSTAWRPEKNGDGLHLQRIIQELCAAERIRFEEMARVLKECRYSYFKRCEQKRGPEEKPFRLAPEQDEAGKEGKASDKGEKEALLAGLKTFSFIVALEAAVVAFFSFLTTSKGEGGSVADRLTLGLILTAVNILLLGVIFRKTPGQGSKKDKTEYLGAGWQDCLTKRMARDKEVLRKEMELQQQRKKNRDKRPGN
ncbi:MAG: DUF6382 domain-containing protein [Peptococcaceae bacterium]|jgi:hypothetical protein|nr:DUF6382 domain-containing protein [Peptococcaceae bacterium]MDH7525098.1 DUF6382 domain-containing protein [Peptococcaceae bacterium]